MKYIDKPGVDDNAAIISLVSNTGLKYHADFLEGADLILLPAYETYQDMKGNAFNISETALSVPMLKALKYYYDHPPPASHSFIDSIRGKMKGEVCPLCGGFNSITVERAYPINCVSGHVITP